MNTVNTPAIQINNITNLNELLQLAQNLSNENISDTQTIFFAHYKDVARNYEALRNAPEQTIEELFATAYEKGHSAGLQNVIIEFENLLS